MFVANVRVQTPPSEEPVSQAEAKAHLRVDGSEENSLISSLIVAAREQAEMIARRAFVSRTLEAQLDCWPRGDMIELAYPPLVSVTSVIYTDADGVPHTMPSADYIVDSHSQPGRIGLAYNASWPTEMLRPRAGITIRYVAGYGNAAAVPTNYKQAILLIVGHLFENREDVVIGGGTVAKIPQAAEWLLLIDRGSFSI